MDTQTNIQKRKRADTVQNDYEIGSDIDPETTIVVDVSRYGKPSNIEDDPNDSDVDQPDDEPLQESTLFKSIQLVIGRGKDAELNLERSSVEHQTKIIPRKIFNI
jgi:hypothetical protein